MPLLGPADPLPFRPQRVTVSGTSGSGKSTLARRIGIALDLPYTEIDSLFHGPGWTPRGSFRADVDRFTAQSRWVTEFQYDQGRPMIARRADLVVWLDIPRRVVRWRVARRTLTRRLRRTDLWNGNREAPLHRLFTDPEHVRLARTADVEGWLRARWLWRASEAATSLRASAGGGTPQPPR